MLYTMDSCQNSMVGEYFNIISDAPRARFQLRVSASFFVRQVYGSNVWLARYSTQFSLLISVVTHSSSMNWTAKAAINFYSMPAKPYAPFIMK